MITVIIPAFNSERYIEKCIRSILKNSYRNLEIIVIDDGSEDNTALIAEKLKKEDNRINVISQEKSGVSAARNKGLDIAKGDYIAFVDSNDYISVDYFEKLVAAFKNDTDIACCRHICVDENEKVLLNPFFKIDTVFTYTPQDLADNYFNLISGVINPACGKLYKKSLIGNTRFSPTLKWGEDANFNLEIYRKMQKMVVLPFKCYFYVIHSGQTISSKIKGRGEMLFEYVGNINSFLKHYNAYRHKKIRMGMGNRCMSDFFAVALNSFSVLEYKDFFLKYKKTDWYQYILETNPKKRFNKLLLMLIKHNRYRTIYYIGQSYNYLVKMKRKIKG